MVSFESLYILQSKQNISLARSDAWVEVLGMDLPTLSKGRFL